MIHHHHQDHRWTLGEVEGELVDAGSPIKLAQDDVTFDSVKYLSMHSRFIFLRKNHNAQSIFSKSLFVKVPVFLVLDPRKYIFQVI